MQLNAGQLQYIRLAQPVSGTQVVQGQIQTLATNAQQVRAPEMQGLGRGPAELASGWKGGLSNRSLAASPFGKSRRHTLHICLPQRTDGAYWRLDSQCVSY